MKTEQTPAPAGYHVKVTDLGETYGPSGNNGRNVVGEMTATLTADHLRSQVAHATPERTKRIESLDGRQGEVDAIVGAEWVRLNQLHRAE